ncbi:MAG: archaeosortase/exosortase family protein [Balneolaceae bacterium]
MLKSPVSLFIIKALAIFVVWYIVYELWLLPDGRLDKWLALNIVSISSGVTNLFGYETWSINRIIGIEESPGLEIIDGCTGISAVGLFLGFILAYPGDWKNKLSFCAIGICVIYLVNIFRVVVLVITQEEWIEFFDITHDYSTSSIFYIIIFLMWILWIKFSEDGFSRSEIKTNE